MNCKVGISIEIFLSKSLILSPAVGCSVMVEECNLSWVVDTLGDPAAKARELSTWLLIA